MIHYFTMVYRRTPRIQQRLDAQRTAILDAASDLLAEHGYAACSMAAVAARAGVAAGTVYRHFTGKSELAAELFRAVVTREVDAVRSAAIGATDASEAITAVIETFAGRALKEPRRAYALLAEPVDPHVAALRLEFRIAFRDVVARAVRDGVASGELPPQNATFVASALVGAIGESLVGPLATGSDAHGTEAHGTEAPDTVSTLVQFAHRAIGGPARAHP